MTNDSYTPLVSFVIPYFNSGKTIDQTLTSIWNQTYNQYEIILVNDGSTDEYSLEKLKQLQNTPSITIIHQENSGPGIARNNAISIAKGNIIVPLDGDDLIEPNAVMEAIQLFESSASDLGVIYGDLAFFGAKNEIKIQEEFDIQKQLLWNQVAVCAFIKKEVFQNTGGYDEFLSKPGLEDWEFWIRVYKKGYKFKKINSIQFKIRVDFSSRTYEQATKNLDQIKKYVYQKHATMLSKEYDKLYYDRKMALETPDYKIGHFILSPYRKLKKYWRDE